MQDKSQAAAGVKLRVAASFNPAIHRTSGKLRLPASGDFQR